ncbi:uncharacterized protein LOC112568253 [Pomacea canaliculata]|uniref:uncharacterized protein LOC112568253 n=1 Tax=Pomacea canaliculata TaxID=400727 RepID=UPI000D72D1C4|nr:uncharacterized protein LOC112568253 [Pomacea canaliculata]
MALVTTPVAITLVLLVITYQKADGTSITCNENGMRRLRELSSSSSWCDSLSPNTTLTWVLFPLSGTSVSLGRCDPSYSCVSLPSRVTSITRNNYWYSSISFIATREMAGTLVCLKLFSNGTTLSDNCTQDIVYPFQFDDVSVITNLQDWTLTAVFSTQKVFSAMDLYYVDIKEYSTQMHESGQYQYFSRLPPVVSKTSFQPYTDGQTYYRGTLAVTWSFPSKGGNYYYTGDIVPDGPTNMRIHPKIRGSIKISEPSPPSTNCRLTYVPEVGPINCQCSTTSLGTPPGRLMWLVGNDVIASGQNGVTQLQFPTNRVNRTHDGLQVTCQLDWVVKQHVVVTDNVAYGPKDVSIQVESENCLVMATCSVDDIKPFTSGMMQWGGLCQGQRGAVCTFRSRGAEDDGKEVTCTVTNPFNNGHNIKATARVTVSDCLDKMARNTMAQSVGTSVGVTVGVLVLLVCSVLVVLWICRRRATGGPKQKSVVRFPRALLRRSIPDLRKGDNSK